MAFRSVMLAWLLGLSVLFLGLLTGCGGGNPNPPPSPPPKASPSASRSSVAVDRASGVRADGSDQAIITVTVRDSSGTPLAGYAVQLEVSGTGTTVTQPTVKTDTSGVATGAVTATQAGVKQVSARVGDDEGAIVVLDERRSIEFVNLPAAKLAFSAAALSATAGEAIGPVLEVVIQDDTGRTVTEAVDEVSLSLASGPSSAVLEGSLTVRAVNGVARFSSAVLKQAGTDYALKATSSELAPATSPAFEVRPAAPTVFMLEGLPSTLVAGGTASAGLTVRDAYGNVVTDYQGTVRFTSTDPAAELPADYSFTAADAGQHTFDVVLKTAANPQQLMVTDTTLSTLTASLGCEVVPGAPTQLRFVTQPANGQVRAALPPVEVELTDEFGNRSRVSSPTVVVSLTGGNAASQLSGLVAVEPVDGLATFSELFVDQEGAVFQLTAGASALPTVGSSAFDVIDDVAPGVVTLTSTDRTSTRITLAWTAVGDDGSLGTAASYELRYSTLPISTRAEFDVATLATTGTPQAPGSAESFTVEGLNAATTYYFAIVVQDSAGNASPLEAQPVATLDPCEGVVCEVPETTCAADGVTRVTFTSACVLEDNLPTCRDTEARMACPGPDGVCFAGACGTATGPNPGELTLSELMHSPSDGTTEYIELHNASQRLLNIAGIQVSSLDGGAIAGGFTLSTGPGHAVLIPAGGVYVVGQNEDFATNGGVPVDYAYNSMLELGGAGHLMIRTVSGTVVEDFTWSGSFPQAPGRSMNLASAVVGTWTRQHPWYWCDSSLDARLLGGDSGTPGQPNESCGVDVGVVPTFCNIQYPKTFPQPSDPQNYPALIPYGSRKTIYSQFSGLNLTDRNLSGNDDYPHVSVELGYGTSADPAGWQWSPARGNPFYDTFSPAFDPMNDEVWGWLRIFTPGTYSYGFRYRLFDPVGGSFSGYTYCDQNGVATEPAAGTYGSVTVGPEPLGPAEHVVISEFSSRGTDGTSTNDSDEFIELYNPTSATVDISGWKVQYMPAEARSYLDLATLPEGTLLPARSFYLIAHTGYTGSVPPELLYGQPTSHLGGNIRIGWSWLGPDIRHPAVVDNLGWGSAYAPEGEAAPMVGAAGSLERKATLMSTAESMEGGEDVAHGNGIDSDWNADDFVVRSARQPQNSTHPPEPP